MLSLTDSELLLFRSIKTVNEVDKVYKCTYCKELLKKPFQAVECGHRFCQECLVSIKKDGNGKKRCPVDKDIIVRTFEDKSALREIMELLCYCLSRESGCPWTGKIMSLFKHNNQCDYILLSCVHHERGCPVRLPKKEMKSHIMQCSYKLADCKFCYEEMVEINLPEHYDLCPHYHVTCPLCGKEELIRGILEQHQRTDCVQCVKPCPAASVGCEFNGTSAEIETHSKESVTYHLSLIGCALAYTGEKVPFYNDLLSTSKSRVLDLENSCDILDNQCKTRPTIVADISNFNETLRTETDKANAALEIRKMSIEESVQLSSDFGLVNRSTVDDVKQKFRAALAMLEDCDRSCKALRKKKSTKKESSEEEIAVRIKKIDEVLTDRSTRSLYNAEVTARLLHARWVHGKALWKVDEVSRRSQEAFKGLVKEIFSPHLLTKVYGFKMCFSLLLNGDDSKPGASLGTVAFRLRLMKTDFDATLRYPFSREITVTVIDQSDENDRKDIQHTIFPEEHLYNYGRPTERMNPPVTIPKLCTHRELYSRNYIKEDVLYLRVEVERFGQEDH